MITNWLVTVDAFSTKIELVDSLNKWDWSCEFEGEIYRYRITSGLFNMPPYGHERAQVDIMLHARNNAGDAPIIWSMRGSKPAVLSKKKQETQSKMKRMF